MASKTGTLIGFTKNLMMYKSNLSGLQMALDVAETHGTTFTTRMNCVVLRSAQTFSEG